MQGVWAIQDRRTARREQKTEKPVETPAVEEGGLPADQVPEDQRLKYPPAKMVGDTVLLFGQGLWLENTEYYRRGGKVLPMWRVKVQLRHHVGTVTGKIWRDEKGKWRTVLKGELGSRSLSVNLLWDEEKDSCLTRFSGTAYSPWDGPGYPITQVAMRCEACKRQTLLDGLAQKQGRKYTKCFACARTGARKKLLRTKRRGRSRRP